MWYVASSCLSCNSIPSRFRGNLFVIFANELDLQCVVHYSSLKILKSCVNNTLALWQYGLWNFQAGVTKLEWFLHKNQHTQRILLNFEFWIIDKLSKMEHHFSNKMIYKLILSKKSAPKLVFFNEKKKRWESFGWFGWFLT